MTEDQAKMRMKIRTVLTKYPVGVDPRKDPNAEPYEIIENEHVEEVREQHGDHGSDATVDL